MTQFKYFTEEVTREPLCMNTALSFENHPVLNAALTSWSEVMYHMHGSPIVLSEKGFSTTNGEVHIPHLSILNTWYPQENIQAVQDALRESLASVEPFDLEFSHATNFDGNLFLQAKNSPALSELHRRVIEITQPFSERHFSRDAWKKLPEKEWGDLLNNGNPYSGTGYNPHITISHPWLSEHEEMNVQIPEDVRSAIENKIHIQRISFGVTNASYGVLTSIVETFPLNA